MGDMFVFVISIDLEKKTYGPNPFKKGSWEKAGQAFLQNGLFRFQCVFIKALHGRLCDLIG